MTTDWLAEAPAPVWHQPDAPPLAPLEGEVRADACVIGLGASGLAAVQALVDAGLSVVGLDARDVGAGAAGRNGGFLLAGLAAFYHEAIARVGHARARAIYRLTIEELDRQFAAHPGTARRTGSLRIADSPAEEDDCARHLEALLTDGFPAAPYDGPEGRGLLVPSDGVFDPLERCRLMARRAGGDGARLFGRSLAASISRGRVATAHGSVSCGRVVVAVDGALERVLPELAGRARSARLQMLATAPTGEIRVPRPVYARWGLEYWQQLPDGRLALGGFRDRGGDAEWTASTEPSAPVQEALERFLRERLGVHAPITHRWAATVSYSPTMLPVLEEVRPDVWACGAYSGTGNVLGVLCGRAAAELAATGRSGIADAFREGT